MFQKDGEKGGFSVTMPLVPPAVLPCPHKDVTTRPDIFSVPHPKKDMGIGIVRKLLKQARL